ncbi:MAG: molybdenum cofactor biosynthesis protein MoaE [Verrucomicrobia bacterium]|nr:molybdenum cofactor biosynthesis protein MoaE [Verrucomicrobiota bacterium]
MEFCDVKLTANPLETPAATFSETEGASVDFFGVVRAMEDSQPIRGIDYEAFTSMAEFQLKRLANEMRLSHRLGLVRIHHRIGFVPAGEPSLYVRVTATHRQAAFHGCSELVDRLKQIVPIWKHPVFAPEE